MGLDIRFSEVKEIRCPICNEFIVDNTIDAATSGGREWYEFLEKIGYYVPYEQRTEENDWYGKDMTLSEEDAKKLFQFVNNYDVYERSEIEGVIAKALLHGNKVVINADW